MANTIHLHLPGCRVDSIESCGGELRISAHTKSKHSNCPKCGHRSWSVHSYYTRSINDLPLSEKVVRLRLRIKRFRCLTSDCRRCTFTESIPGCIVAYARRTPRLTHELWHVGQVAGRQAGARLATCLRIRMPTTRHTLLRLLRQQPVAEGEMLRIIGVDDWAKRRGQTYGTIVVDLERHRVVDLLPNRDAQTVRNWLSGWPSIQIVARDRSLEYTQGITSGALQAIQVADRWHLLKNLWEAVERALQDVLPALLNHTTLQAGSGDHPRANFPRSQAESVKQLRSRQQRLETYSRIQVLKQHGYSMRRIARILGLSRGVVTRAYKADVFPERAVRYVPSQLDPYLEYLEQCIVEGCWNSQQLWREISGLGYPGRPSQVTKWMQWRRRNQPSTSAKTAEIGASPLPSPCQRYRPVCTCLLPNQTACQTKTRFG